MITVPEVVRQNALLHGQADWLADLPALIAGVERDWSLVVGRAYQDGTEALVAEADLVDGTPAALKLVIPRPGNHARNEITALRLAGDGCVRLLRADPDRHALLLERLGPALSDQRVPIDRRHDILLSLAQRVWRPAPPDCPLPTGADKGRRLITLIRTQWESTGRPCAERTIEYAVACAERRIAAHDPARAVLIHGDVHQWNTLRAGDSYKLVDPDGVIAEPECDLGVLMREDITELMAEGPRTRAHRLADRTNLDHTRIWEWGLIELVSNGLICYPTDLRSFGRDSLAAADHMAEIGAP